MSNREESFKRLVLLGKMERDAREPYPFKTKELGEARALEFEKRQVQREMDAATSAYLKANGFLASGQKPKRRK